MGIIFDAHNEYGRLVDEAVFKSIIALRCEQAGITPAQREVRIRVRHESSAKEHMKEHLLRFLRHTRLHHMQWVNFNQARMEFTTLSRQI